MRRSTKIFSAALLSLAIALPLAACGGSAELLEEHLIEDQYDNYYEIFVRSFYDSDGNGVGDFNGVTEKLDYVRDMGYTGIWLMPINPTGSYHGYDVQDYKAVNPSYGSMEDFENLVEKAHSLGIKVIIDMVFNHSSNKHPWFLQGVEAFQSGQTVEENKYVDYYTFSDDPFDGSRLYNGVYAEARFDISMPDLNLDSPYVQAELEDIVNFWIGEKNVDGFRLDAVRYFYYGNAIESAKFTGKIKDWADAAYKKAHPDEQDGEAFIVGEDWSGQDELERFYDNANGAAFFDFQVSQTGKTYIPSAINTATHATLGNPARAADKYFESVGVVLDKAKGPNGEQYVPAPFLDNHDVARIAGVASIALEEERIKFAYGLLSLYTGSTFTYYGSEIGMTGSANDPEKRVGILWTEDTVGMYPPGASHDPARYYPFPSVEDQLKDKGSILNYYKLCNNARNAFPALMRGTAVRVASDNENVLVFTKTYKDETITIAVNFSTETQTVTGLGDALTLKQGICVDGSVSGSGASLKLPKLGIAILA